MSATALPAADVRRPGWLWTGLGLAIGCWLMAVCWHEWLSEGSLAANFDSESGRRWLIRRLGGKLTGEPLGTTARVPFENVLISNVIFTLLWWLGGATALAARHRRPWSESLLRWGADSYGWWLLAASWTIARFVLTLAGWTSGVAVVSALPEMWLSFASAGWIATFVCRMLPPRPSTNASPPAEPRRWQMPSLVWLAIVIYAVTFGTMNTLLYQNLLLPHGDSAMYEEHLWNLLHGKGFRSFIDKGLFLGEHIQVIHLGLIPIYVLWPSHVLMEWCESLGLALGAVPVFSMALRQTRSRMQATCLAIAYLLYVPMQRLDISIDFKTFRPEAFGIPLLLATLNALEARRWMSFGIWLLATLLVKEDYALIVGPLGVWMAWDAWRARELPVPLWRRVLPGLLLAAFSVVYLWWAVKVAIPYFKAGNEVHYARYFSQFGSTTNEILWNLATRPDRLLAELCSAENFLFGAALILPLAGLPLLSPTRLAVGLPLFGALCLNQIARNAQHHFHAPLVAIAFWAAASGLRHVPRLLQAWPRTWPLPQVLRLEQARFVVLMAMLASSGFHFWHGLSPGGLPFWDTLSSAFWKRKYASNPRARHWPDVAKLISPDKRVASTDFIHPRFNHHARSYDYSGYRPDVPEDADFLVIDVHGPYSEIKRPEDVPEIQKFPERWELLPDETEGYFLVFRRRAGNPTP